MENTFLLLLSILGLLMELVFGTFPYWQVTSEKLEELIKLNEYTFHDRQFYYTFVILGGFSNILGIIGAIKNHHFIFINVIWLASFCAASFLIKIVWELIFMLTQYLSDDAEEVKTTYWPILVKYVIGVVFYSLQVWLAYRGRQKIIEIYNKVIMNNISRSEIEVLYNKLDTVSGDPEMRRALSANKNHLNSLLNSMGDRSLASTNPQRMPSMASKSPSVSGWQKTNSFTGPGPMSGHQTSSLSSQHEGTQLLHNNSVIHHTGPQPGPIVHTASIHNTASGLQ